MRLKTLENQMRVYMNPDDYEALKNAAPDKETYLGIRYMAETSLRSDEVLDVTKGDHRRSTHRDVDIWFLPIVGKDTRDRDTDGKRREVWVPQSLKTELDDYYERKALSSDAPFFRKAKRTLRRRVKEAGEVAANRKQEDGFSHVTPHDLRAYFATNMHVRQGVDKGVVMELGGWDDHETFQRYVHTKFDDIIQDELAATGVLDIGDVESTTKIGELKAEIATLQERITELETELSEQLDDIESEVGQITVRGATTSPDSPEQQTLGSFDTGEAGA